MDELDLLLAAADRGAPRGATAVWDGARRDLAAAADGDEARADDAPAAPPITVVELRTSASSHRRPGRLRLPAVAAAAVLVAGGLGVARVRSNAARRAAAPDTTSATTAAATTVDGAFGRLVAPHLPAGFRVVSTGRTLFDGARPQVLALDAAGRVLTVGFGLFDRELARDTGAPPPVEGVTGDASTARYLTAAGDEVTASCVFGAQPCEGAAGIAAGAGSAVVDARTLAAAVGAAVAPLSRDQRGALTSVTALTDEADGKAADAVLDRFSTVLGAGYALADNGGGVVPQRTWRGRDGGPDAARAVTVFALPSPLTVEASADRLGDAASAVASAPGWIFVAVAQPGVPPAADAFLRNQLSYALGALTDRDAAAPSAPAGEGRLVLDGPPAGWRVEWANDQRQPGVDTSVARIYAGTSATPERDPWIALVSTQAQMALEPSGKGVEAVRVQGAAGQLAVATDAAGRVVRLTFGPVAGQWVMLETHGLTRERALEVAAAVAAAPGERGLAVPAAALPAGLVERAVGRPSESLLMPRSADDAPIPGAHWTDDTNILWYSSFRADPALLPIFRLDGGTWRDATIAGHPGFTTERGSVRRAVWSDGDRIYLVGSNAVDGNGPGIPLDRLLALLEHLRPATTREWDAMLAATAQAAATAPVATTAVGAPG